LRNNKINNKVTLDDIISECKLLKVSVGKIIDTLYDFKKNRYNSLKGSIIHYKLGFNNDELFQRYLDLSSYGYDNTYLLIRGVPDRIVLPYVDELKTTVRNNDGIIIDVAVDQLQLYMFITGLDKGRLYIYYKDTKELELFDTYRFNRERFDDIIRTFMELYSKRKRISNSNSR